ncbi:MAG TPA: hypothetical protein VJH91_00555 [Candidatus Paceibacterota bacterium]
MRIPKHERQDFCDHGFKKRSPAISNKNIVSWCPILESFEASHTIQAGEYSMAGGTEGVGHTCGSVLANVNWNDINQKWNVNDWNPDNDVNAGRRVFSGNWQCSPAST